MKRKTGLAILVATGALLAAGLAHADAKPMQVGELAKLSQVVVVGEVVSVSMAASDDGARVHTEVEVRVAEVLKGNPSATLKIRMLGGQVGTRVSYLPGAPYFQQGAKVLLFLEERRDKRGWLPIGMGEGVLTVTGSEVARPAVESFGRTSRPVALAPERVRPIPIAEVRRAIREAGR